MSAVQVGDLVMQQLYSPTQPSWDATLEERIAGGVLYGKPRLMRVAQILPAETGPHPLSGKPLPAHTERYWLVDPERPKDQSLMSWCDDNWCVLTPVVADGALF